MQTKLQCPKCEAEMNRHAEKIIYAAESVLEAVLEEFHACPRCGASLSRVVPAEL